jgi:hypothetical protein
MHWSRLVVDMAGEVFCSVSIFTKSRKNNVFKSNYQIFDGVWLVESVWLKKDP